LEGSGPTLRHLDLVCINWSSKSRPFLNKNLNSETNLFDWNILGPMVQLQSLRISMVCSHIPHQVFGVSNLCRGGKGFETRNFQTLELNALEKLELAGISLSRQHMEKIFRGFPQLKDIRLNLWSKTIAQGTVGNLGSPLANPIDTLAPSNTQLCNLMLEGVQQRRFEKISLIDESLMWYSPITENLFGPAKMIPRTVFNGLARPGLIDMDIIRY